MMRERAVVTGGTFKVESQPGRGTTITAHFPQVWVEEGSDTTWTETTNDPAITSGGAPGNSSGQRAVPGPGPDAETRPIRRTPPTPGGDPPPSNRPRSASA
jgi:hypothetical protein